MSYYYYVMLSYKNRFHGHNSLRYVYRNGKTIRSQYFTIKVSNNPRRSEPRIAVIVSKKVLKSAVGRNRIRRRMYELFRLELPKLSPNLDIACIISSSEVRTLEAEILKAKFLDQLTQARLYKKT